MIKIRRYLIYPYVETTVRSGILEIGKKKDLTVNLRHVMNFGDGKFEIEILNTGEIVYDMEKFAEIAGKYV